MRWATFWAVKNSSGHPAENPFGNQLILSKRIRLIRKIRRAPSKLTTNWESQLVSHLIEVVRVCALTLIQQFFLGCVQ
jgi:hypothetical protein